MRKQNRKDEDKQFVLGILVNRSKDKATSMEEIEETTFFSRERIKKIIHVLAVRDKVPIKVTDFPYRFYIEKAPKVRNHNG